jgi:hypothetical protein
MNTAITAQKEGEIIEAVMIKGEQLTPIERAKYYRAVCDSLELNVMTRPFIYLKLNGRLTLYPTEICAAQLRAKHGVSITDLTAEEREDGVYVVTVKVVNKDGRSDMATGAVNIAGLKGEALANAVMKAETKAKRRVSLSICGLGHQDESELPAAAAPVQTPPQDRRLRLADQLDALGTAPDIEPKRSRRGRPRKDDEPTDEEIAQSQARLAELLEEEEPPLTGEEAELQVDDGWPGPTGAVRHDYEQGKRDAIAGRTDCLNREIRDIATRYAEWKKGFDSVKKNR